MKKPLVALALLASLMPITLMAPAQAASSKPVVTVTPFLQQISLTTADATKNFNVVLTNDSAVTQQFHLSVLDFGSLDESGGVVFAGAQASSLVKKYGLSSWLRLSSNDLTLEAGQKATIEATIINDTSLQPGGHYGAIIASLKSSPGNGGTNQVNIKQNLSALILATKVGGEKYDLKLNRVSYATSWRQLPQTLNLRFQNPGNVHVVPRGTVKLLAPGGRVVATGVINDNSSFVLPETYRQIAVDLHQVGQPGRWPAIYHLRVDYRYDGIDRFASKSYAIYFMNLPVLLLLLLGLAVAGGVAYKFIHKRRHQPKDK